MILMVIRISGFGSMEKGAQNIGAGIVGLITRLGLEKNICIFLISLQQ